MSAAKHTPGQSLDAVATRLVSLRRLARLERKELGAVSPGTLRKIAESMAAAEAVCVVDDARAAIAKVTGSAS